MKALLLLGLLAPLAACPFVAVCGEDGDCDVGFVCKVEGGQGTCVRPEDARICDPGRTLDCTCGDGGRGIQTCDASGRAASPCECVGN